MVNRNWARPRSFAAFSDYYRDVWEWAFFVAEQYAGAVARAAVSADDDSRQRGGGASAADRGTEDYPSAGHHWIFDGSAAGVSVGGELSDVCGSNCGDGGHGQDLWAWRGATRRADRSADCGRGIQRWRLHHPTLEGDGSIRYRVDRVVVLAGVVAEGIVEGRREAWNDL